MGTQDGSWVSQTSRPYPFRYHHIGVPSSRGTRAFLLHGAGKGFRRCLLEFSKYPEDGLILCHGLEATFYANGTVSWTLLEASTLVEHSMQVLRTELTTNIYIYLEDALEIVRAAGVVEVCAIIISNLDMLKLLGSSMIRHNLATYFNALPHLNSKGTGRRKRRTEFGFHRTNHL